MPGALRIEPIRARHLDDLDALFARGDPKQCQCAYLRMTGGEYDRSTPTEHRSEHHKAIRRAQRRGAAAGMIAYDHAGPIGWVSFGPREEYARLVASPVLQPVDDQPVTSVVCFVIAARARRKGVASALLDAVINYASEHGIATLEAYPVEWGDKRPSGASLWRGPVALYQSAGFTVTDTRRANKVARPQLIMRKSVQLLAPPSYREPRPEGQPPRRR
jgi:GNAT superfamily N-acetyltransferase